jgi:apolipoprotein N-acyltransferase
MAADFVFWLCIAFIVGANLYYGPQIVTTHVAMQWGFDGKPTWRAPKVLAIWGIVVFALAVRGFIWLAMTHSPERVNNPEVGLLLFSVILAAAHFWVLRSAVRSQTS